MGRDISVGVSYEEHNLNESFYDWVLTTHDIIVAYLKWVPWRHGPPGDDKPQWENDHARKSVLI